jgi:Mn2+/Fe2+ NRAMP family transporter
VKKLLGLALGVLTAIGGFVDVGDLVTSSLTGARFGLSLAWAIVLGVVGICVFAEMSGRVAAITHRAAFDLVRERLGPRVGLANLVASLFVTALTFAAEIGGVALTLELATSINYLLWVPVVGVLVWVVVWRVKFTAMENTFGLLGLAMVVFAVAVWKLGPDWGSLLDQVLHPSVPQGEGHPTYLYFAVALLGSAMTPYEVFFFSSGGVEEKWTEKDIGEMRANVFVGFPLGALLSLSVMAAAALVLQPLGIQVSTLGDAALPVALVLGKAGLCVALVGFFATTYGAALETGLSVGYSVAQYFGWAWGKMVAPLKAARFHLVVLATVVLGVGVVLTTIDPVQITEYSVVFSAVALPLTYLPILVVANDPDYMGERTNSRLTNGVATVFLVLLCVVSVVTIPLMIATKAGQ